MASESSAHLVWNTETGREPIFTDTSREIKYFYPFPLIESGLFGEKYPWSENKPPPENRLFQGDNLSVLHLLLEQGYQGKFDLIYIDPPYLSDNSYTSTIEVGNKNNKKQVKRHVFHDRGPRSIDSYLDQIYPRLLLMKELLSEQGSIFVHLDWHVSHYVKVLLDQIFSVSNFINEIVWCYTGGSGTKRHFHRKHDIILWYSRSKNHIFNPQYRPYSEGTLQRGLTKVKGDRYSLRKQGAIMQDWWTDINKILSPTARENLKFPTQKPLALLERLILTASNPGSLVGDFYAGSCTLAQAGSETGRKWILCDNNKIAIQTGLSRLLKSKSPPFTLEILGEQECSNEQVLQIKPLLHKYNSDSVLVNLGLKNYYPGDNAGNDPGFPNIIDFWDADVNYDHKIYISGFQIVRDKPQYDDKITLDINLLLPYRKHYTIAACAYDIFGNNASTVMDFDLD